MLRRRLKSALLIDFDNLVSKFGPALSDRVENWLAWLEDGCFDPGGPRREFVLKRTYWFTDNDVHRPFFVKHGIEATVTRAVKNKEKASSADFDITIDAVEMSHKNRKLDEVIILSFDSDFLTVLNHLQVKEISVVGMAYGNDRPAQAFRRLADNVIEKEEFDVALRYVRPQKRLFAKAVVQEAPPPEPVRRAAPRAQPKPQPAPKAAAAPKPAAPKPARSARPTFDLKRAAAIAAEAAASAPSAYLSKRFVCRALEKFEGFAVTGAHPWLGCGTYQGMIERFAKLNSNLSVDRVASGALALIYRGGASEAA